MIWQFNAPMRAERGPQHDNPNWDVHSALSACGTAQLLIMLLLPVMIQYHPGLTEGIASQHLGE